MNTEQLLAAVQARRIAQGLRVRYISPLTGKEVSCVRANRQDLEEFCDRITIQGGRVLSVGE